MELMTAKDVCALLKIQPRALRRWREKGIFPEPMTFETGTIRWDREVVEAWVKGQAGDRGQGTGDSK